MDYILIGLITSAVINLLLLIGVRNLLKQNEQLEDRVIFTVDDTRIKVSTCLEKMKSLDIKEAFEKDDEVGVVFLELKKTIEELNNQI
tara:strand:- start:1315 stop:1578 length:264 start_codon:yes stop_codon:yes gene_type:complete